MTFAPPTTRRLPASPENRKLQPGLFTTRVLIKPRGSVLCAQQVHEHGTDKEGSIVEKRGTVKCAGGSKLLPLAL